jgi:hypothetical protein
MQQQTKGRLDVRMLKGSQEQHCRLHAGSARHPSADQVKVPPCTHQQRVPAHMLVEEGFWKLYVPWWSLPASKRVHPRRGQCCWALWGHMSDQFVLKEVLVILIFIPVLW